MSNICSKEVAGSVRLRFKFNFPYKESEPQRMFHL